MVDIDSLMKKRDSSVSSLENLFKFKKRILDTSILTNIKKLSSEEQKSIAVLTLARHELGRLHIEDRDEFSSALLDYLILSAPSFDEIFQLFEDYFNERSSAKKEQLYLRAKPIEALAMYLSEIADIFNRVPKETEQSIKAFTYNLLLHWFEAEGTKSVYLSEMNLVTLQPEIDKLIAKAKGNTVAEDKLKDSFDNSIEMVEFLKGFKYRFLLPDRAVKGQSKAKKRKRK